MANLQSLTVSGSLGISGVFQLPDLRVDKQSPSQDTPNNMYWAVKGRNEEISLKLIQTGSWSPVWSQSTNTNQFVQCGMATGTTNATLLVTGCTPSGVCLCTEEWNGTSWTAVNAHLGNRFQGAMTGTQDEALFFGYCACNNTACINNDAEIYDGLTWSCTATTNYNLFCHDATGTACATLAFGGKHCNVPSTTCEFCRTEEFNGSSWTTGPSMNCARQRAKGAGSANATVATGGCCIALCANCCCFCSSPGLERPFQCDTEEYDGTAWSKTGNTVYGFDCGFGMTGTANDAWIFGGGCCNSMHYDGIGWNMSNSNPTDTCFHGSSGNGNGSLQIGGNTYKCEVYKMELPLQFVPREMNSVWTQGPNMQCCYREEGHSFGPATSAASYVGGCCCRFADNFDGIHWAMGGYNAWLTSQSCSRWGVGWGASDAAYITAGLCGASKLLYFDGTSLSCVRTNSGLSGSFAGGTGLGDIDVALVVGDTCTAGESVEMNYITFAQCAPYTACHCYGTGLGTVDGGYVIGGEGSVNAPNNGTCVEYYDGTSWSAGNNVSYPRCKSGATGTANNGVVIGGINSCFCVEHWNGTTWATDTQTSYRKDNRPGMVGEDACGYAFGGNECGCTCTEFRVGFDNCNYHWCCAQECCEKGIICMGISAIQAGPTLPTAMYCPNGAGHGHALTIWGGGYCCATQAYNGISWAQESIDPCCSLYGGFSGGSPYDTITVVGQNPSNTTTSSTLLYDGLSYYTCGGNHQTSCSVGSGGSTVAVQYPGGGCCCRIACWAASTWRWCHVLYPSSGCCLPQSSASGGNYYAGFHIGCGGQAWCIRNGYTTLPNMSQPVIFGHGVGSGQYEMGWWHNCCLCGYDGIAQWNTSGRVGGCRRGSGGGGRFIEEAWSAGGPYLGGSTFQFRTCCPMTFSRADSADTKFICNDSEITKTNKLSNFYDSCTL